ncbi:MAG TPA: hypothetical protein VE614_21435 [Streptomyces sp.]|nr:hypothetical protein [Streptomyces sp.]HZF90902.1 hypothetical protein [Streptomyces sp.]
MLHPHTHLADTYVEELRTALDANGITLPSLGLQLPSAVGAYAPPLIALGNCTMETARALATALRKAAGE